MITKIKLFTFIDDAITRQEVNASATLDTMPRHVFIKHYIYNLVQVAAVIQYSDKQTQPDSFILKLVCDRLDRLFFGWASLSNAAAAYSARRPLIVQLPTTIKQTTAPTAADAIVNAAFVSLLCEVPREKSVITRRLILTDVITAKFALIKYDLVPVEKLRGVSSFAEYNVEVENSALFHLLSDIEDTSPTIEPYAPNRDVRKIFTAFNTLYKTTDTPTTIDAQSVEPTTIDADTIDDTPTTSGWGDWSDDDQPDGAQSVEPTTIDAQSVEPTTVSLDAATIINIERGKVKLPERKDSSFALSKYEFSQAAQAVIVYVLNNVIPDCLRKLRRGELKTPNLYLLKFEPRKILRAVGIKPDTRQARAVNAAVRALFVTPLKYTQYIKTKKGIQRNVSNFHFIDFYAYDDDGNVTMLQISPYILTPGHPVNKAFCRYLPVDKAFNGGTYSIAADCTDVATVVNTLISDVKPGDVVYWAQIFDTYKFSDSRDRRVKQKILATFEKRGFKVELVDKYGFKFFGTATDADSPTTSTATTKTTARKTTKNTARKTTKNTARKTTKTTKK